MNRRTCLLATVLCLLCAAGAPGQDGVPQFGTRSIAACDGPTQACGVAVVSFPTGVPAVVPVGKPRIVVANQASPLIDNAERIVALIEGGAAPEDALAEVLAGDAQREVRQIGVAAIGSDDVIRVANFTGSFTTPQTCAVAGADFTVQANLQRTSLICQTMADAFQKESAGFPNRLLAAMRAGAEAGGDSRGEFSAALVVFGQLPVAVRGFTRLSAFSAVNRSREWLPELEYNLKAYLAFWTLTDAADLILLNPELILQIQQALINLGFLSGAPNGVWTDATELAWRAFQGRNLAFTQGTIVQGEDRLIDQNRAFYLIEGERRGVLRGPA